MGSPYDIGDKRRLQVTFQDSTSVDADPTTTTFKMTEPNGTTTTYVYGTDAEVVKSATGIYYVDWSITQDGRHHYRWAGTGAVETAEEASFDVKATNIL